MGVYPEFIGWQIPLERTLPNLTTIIVMKPGVNQPARHCQRVHAARVVTS
jgi:hypothetical protein